MNGRSTRPVLKPPRTQRAQRTIERDPLTEKVIGCAIEVHRFLGPGLHESADEQCLARELAVQGIEFQLQVPVPVEYQGVRRDCDYRIDILVDQQLGRIPLVRDDAFRL